MMIHFEQIMCLTDSHFPMDTHSIPSFLGRIFLVAFLAGCPLACWADSSGTGFFVSADGYLVTNHHVIEEGKKFFVKQGQVTREAKLVVVDAENDLAILKVASEATPFPFLAVQGKLDPTPGSDAFTIGFPDPEDLGLTPKTTKGSITALAGFQDDPRHYQTSVQIQPGNSGGPLIDESGHVVGVTTLTINALKQAERKGYLPQNINYAVKSSYLLELFKKVPGTLLGAKLSGLQPRHFRDLQKEAEAAVMLVYSITKPAPPAPAPQGLQSPKQLFQQ